MTDFDEYIIGGNPSQKEKSYAWKTAIGLQDVDGLKPSEYLVQTAKQNIEGDITIRRRSSSSTATISRLPTVTMWKTTGQKRRTRYQRE